MNKIFYKCVIFKEIFLFWDSHYRTIFIDSSANYVNEKSD